MKKNLKYFIHRIKRSTRRPVSITAACVGCGKCARICPMEGCIVAGEPFRIDYNLCMRCAKCVAVCPVEAIVQVG